jgi:hypothetical protein
MESYTGQVWARAKKAQDLILKKYGSLAIVAKEMEIEHGNSQI